MSVGRERHFYVSVSCEGLMFHSGGVMLASTLNAQRGITVSFSFLIKLKKSWWIICKRGRVQSRPWVSWHRGSVLSPSPLSAREGRDEESDGEMAQITQSWTLWVIEDWHFFPIFQYKYKLIFVVVVCFFRWMLVFVCFDFLNFFILIMCSFTFKKLHYECINNTHFIFLMIQTVVIFKFIFYHKICP